MTVDISLPELKSFRSSHIQHLLHPLHTVLDDSIGCAIWFAARGKGVDLVSGEEVQTPARVLLLGMGIDEQMGGYSRHRTRFVREGHEGLADELKMELLRISERNLGRDNRIVRNLLEIVVVIVVFRSVITELRRDFLSLMKMWSTSCWLRPCQSSVTSAMTGGWGRSYC